MVMTFYKLPSYIYLQGTVWKHYKPNTQHYGLIPMTRKNACTEQFSDCFAILDSPNKIMQIPVWAFCSFPILGVLPLILSPAFLLAHLQDPFCWMPYQRGQIIHCPVASAVFRTSAQLSAATIS